jgi:Ca-activated chloride channel family protein
LRYKDPDASISKLITETIPKNEINKESVSNNFQFASSVAEFGLLLRDSQFKGNASFQNVLTRAQQAKERDEWGYRQEFINLLEKARDLAPINPNGYNFKGQQ